MGELIAPTQPQREERVREEGGSWRCSYRSCILHQSGALQEVTSMRSRWGDQLVLLHRRQTCSTPYLVYHILCPYGGAVGGAGAAGGVEEGAGGGQSRDYVGSAYSIKRRWSKHKSDIRKHIWTACGLTRHFERFHQGDMEVAISNLQVTLLDHLEGPFTEEGLRDLEQGWMYKLGTFQNTGCNSRLELTSRSRRTWGNAF